MKHFFKLFLLLSLSYILVVPSINASEQNRRKPRSDREREQYDRKHNDGHHDHRKDMRHRHEREQPPVIVPVVNVLNDDGFNLLIKFISASTFNSDKLNILKAGCISNFFTMKQCSIIMDQFTFRGKVDAARAMAPHIVDRENFWMLLDKVDFSSDKDEIVRIFTPKQ